MSSRNPRKKTSKRPKPSCTFRSFLDQLIEDVSSGNVDFSSVDPEIRGECIFHLIARGWPRQDIATLLNVTQFAIYEDESLLAKAEGESIMAESAAEIIGSLKLFLEGVKDRALSEKKLDASDAKALFDAELAIVELAIELGVAVPLHSEKSLARKSISLTSERLRQDVEGSRRN